MAADLRTQPGPHVFVADLEHPELSDDDRHHLAKSLRLRSGDALTISNGTGGWRTAIFGDAVEPSGPVHDVAVPAYELGLGIALTKAAKPEFAVQKATELGIDTIVVFAAEHSVARWDEHKRAKNQPRLERVAREAAMQSRRVTIPTVFIAEDLAAVAQQHPVVRADFGGAALDASHRFLLIGPEGGWSTAETELVPAAVDLGSTVLRAETAAVVGAAFLTHHRSQND